MNIRVRIALLSCESKHCMSVGGLVEHVTELAGDLRRRGHEVHLFTRFGTGQSGHQCIEGVRYRRCPGEPRPDFLMDDDRMCDRPVWHLAETEGVFERPFDIMHAHDWLTVRALVQPRRTHGRPSVMTMHSTEYRRAAAGSMKVRPGGFETSNTAVSLFSRDFAAPIYPLDDSVPAAWWRAIDRTTRPPKPGAAGRTRPNTGNLRC